MRADPHRKSIALLLDRLSLEYGTHLRRSIERAATARGISVLTVAGQSLGDSEASARAQNQIYSLISSERVDGVIIVSSRVGNHCGQAGLLALCRELAPLPICSVGVELPGIPSLVVDNEAGMHRGVSHLIVEHGCRHIAFIAAHKESVESNFRLAGYKKALQDAALPFDPALVRHGDFTAKLGASCMSELLQSGVHFDAVVAANDDMAIGALDVLSEAGFVVPRDVIVAGFDDINLAHFARPSLSTLRQPMAWLGERALDSILDQIAGKDVAMSQAGSVDFVCRESCGCGNEEDITLHVSQVHRASVHDIISEHWQELTTAMRLAVTLPQHVLGNWPSVLLDALDEEFNGRSGRFSAAFEEILDRAQREGATLDEFQRVVSVLRSTFGRFRLDQVSETSALERLWHKARVLVGAASIRLLGRQKSEMQEVSRGLSAAGERLVTTLSLSRLREEILESLPGFSISRCSISLYTAAGSHKLKLLVGLIGRTALTPKTDQFSDRQLGPEEIFEGDIGRHFIVMPISFETEILGVAVFESGVPPNICEALRHQIGAAVKGAMMHREMVKQITLRERLEKERIAGEAHLAAAIQTSVQPDVITVTGLEIAAFSEPAAEAGGDYYDVLPASCGAWLAIGDVTGHGLASGLVMLMIQSMVSSLTRQELEISPSQVVSAVGDALWDNVRQRLKRDDHATLTVLRYQGRGRFSYAGAHEDMIVWRQRSGKCETITTPGFWVGAVPSVRSMTHDSEMLLELGDLLVLYTDGITEARNAHQEQYSLERLVACVERVGHLAAQLVCDAIAEAARSWTANVDDDMTLLVVRYVGDDLPA